MDCSSRGLCDYSTGTCNCFKGFAGTLYPPLRACAPFTRAALRVVQPTGRPPHETLVRRAACLFAGERCESLTTLV
ncbi:hypothetical protein EON68_00635 [archaeon]|nr:MAG: hypothetical protein EON68_00635 [archaeon]